MGLIDRVKEAAQEVAVEAKKVSAQAQGKLEETQLKRRMDDNAKKLGYLVYKERTKGVVEGAEAEQLISELTSLELQIARAAADSRAKQEAAAQSGQPGGQQPEPPAPSSGTGPPAPQGESVAPPPSPPTSEPPSPTS